MIGQDPIIEVMPKNMKVKLHSWVGNSCLFLFSNALIVITYYAILSNSLCREDFKDEFLGKASSRSITLQKSIESKSFFECNYLGPVITTKILRMKLVTSS